MSTFNRIQSILQPLPRKFKVRFALNCCDDVKALITDPDSLEAIRITKLWLEDKATTAEVEMAGDKAYEVANAYASSYAAYAAYAASRAASYASATAAASASTASSAANASRANASASSYDTKMLQYEADLKNMIKDLTKLEKLVYNIKRSDYEISGTETCRYQSGVHERSPATIPRTTRSASQPASQRRRGCSAGSRSR